MSNEQDRSSNMSDSERLRERHSDDNPDVAHAARLVAAARLREPTDEQADRVWRRLEQGGPVRSRAPSPWLRPALAAFAVVGMASLAFAAVTVGRRLVEEWRGKAPSAAAPANAGSHHGASPAGRTIGSAAPAADPAAAIAPSVKPPAPADSINPAGPIGAPSALPAPSAAAPAALLHPRARPSLPDPAVAVNNALDAEVYNIKDAVNALRRDGDAERARMLLDYYLGHFPDGLFHEEALALSVEATEKAGDHGGAAGLASRYLKRYPEGRYRLTVERLAERASHKVRP